jgi:hypothetical protein
VSLDDVASDGEAQPGASPARASGYEGLEDFVSELRRDSWSGVLDLEHDRAFARRHPDQDAASCRGGLDRVAEQVVHDQLELDTVAVDGGRAVGTALQHHVARLGPHLVELLPRNCGEVEDLAFEPNRAGELEEVA